MTPSSQLIAAVRHHQAGQFEAAERLYREAIAIDPSDVHALHLAGVLAHQTNRNAEAAELIGRAIALDDRMPDFHYNLGLALWALDRREDAAAHWARVIALNPDHAEAHMNLGNALREQGLLDEAVTHLRRALQLKPSPFAHNNLGLALGAIGDAEAVAHYRRAIEMHPGFLEPHLNLAIELAAAGQNDQALASVRRSLQIKETPENKDLFVRIAAALDAVGEDPGLRHLVTRAVSEQWGRTNELIPLIAILLRHGSAIEPLMARAEAGVAGKDLLGASDLAIMAGEPLLQWLLESAVVTVFALEQILTAARALLLDPVTTASIDETMLRFACALARQCYINEYVFAVSDDERARADGLGNRLVAALDSGAPVNAFSVAVVAAYRPLHELAADALLARTWPAPLVAVIDQQVLVPRAEAAARVTIPQLTAIEDDVSRRVRDQYEQNPYPRWTSVGRVRKYASIDALMQQEFPHAPFQRIGKDGSLDILTAGCGTGRQAISVAQQFEHAQVLAIDLSSASLGYAKARTQALGVANIEYAQADILQLGSIGRSFDMIQAGGVLHHLADPWAGWRVLLTLLNPGGVMHVALYSEIARRDVVAARALIAERGYGATIEDIRACRAEIMNQDDGSPLKRVMAFNDFFTTSECRDLLFHVQEHRMTLPSIKAFLGENGLRFLGFELDVRPKQRYAARFPDDLAMTDLDQWDAFEQDNPYSFMSMYRFLVQKGAA